MNRTTVCNKFGWEFVIYVASTTELQLRNGEYEAYHAKEAYANASKDE